MAPLCPSQALVHGRGGDSPSCFSVGGLPADSASPHGGTHLGPRGQVSCMVMNGTFSSPPPQPRIPTCNFIAKIDGWEFVSPFGQLNSSVLLFSSRVNEVWVNMFMKESEKASAIEVPYQPEAENC